MHLSEAVDLAKIDSFTEGLQAKFESGLGKNVITFKSFQSLIDLFMTSSY